MSEFKIERWDAVIPPGRTFPYPIIYIKPDQEFPFFAKSNNYLTTVVISDTGLQYDGTPIMGYISPGSEINQGLPNMYNITLLCDFLGYPVSRGKVSFMPNSSDAVRAMSQAYQPKIIPIIQVAETEPERVPNLPVLGIVPHSMERSGMAISGEGKDVENYDREVVCTNVVKSTDMEFGEDKRNSLNSIQIGMIIIFILCVFGILLIK